ncbi:hypothetical protein KKH3_23840 [Pectobacterium actinidiae]|nr:hypothetical protein KKH3_23840 [Pectobacterium actinidiae]
MKMNILSCLRKKPSDLVFLPNFVAQLPKKPTVQIWYYTDWL